MNENLVQSLSVAITLLIKLGHLDHDEAMTASKNGEFFELINATYNKLLEEGKINNA